MPTLDTIDSRVKDHVLYATLNTLPLNMISPASVRDPGFVRFQPDAAILA
jgi:hypothetical protein